MMRLLLCVLLLPALASAEIYRWTDASGQVHFEQRPNGAGAQRVEVKPQVVERDQATRERQARTERFYDARRDEQAQAAAATAERRAKTEQTCTKLRKQLEQMPEGYRYYRPDADGERSYYSDQEMDAARQHLRSEIGKNCS
ncbi:DUF4124 domain-containing protein [Pseudomonas marincola]|nr:DUF4124 domain-containing protein [Pseudomonas marincola]